MTVTERANRCHQTRRVTGHRVTRTTYHRGMTTHRRTPSTRYPAPPFDADGVPEFFRLTPAQYDALVAEVMLWRSDSYGALRRAWKVTQERWGPSSRRFKVAVRQAMQRGHSWTIPPAVYERLVAQPCAECGEPTGSACGLDRLDHARGYDEDNVRPCCGGCNYRRGRRALVG